MKVTLFPAMRSEGWASMDRYADALVREFSVLPPEADPPLADGFRFSVFRAEPPLKSSRIKLFWRTAVYPRLAALKQGEVNHILDHSYAHLLDFLDPQKTVVTCHDLIPLEYESDPLALARFRQAVGSLPRARLIVADSQSAKRDLVEKLSIPPEKIEVIYLGVDPAFRPLPSAFRKREGLDKFKIPAGKIILSFGNNLRYKNVEGILTAFKEVLAVEPSARLVRAGAELTVGQAQLAADLGITASLFELGPVIDDDLVRLYQAAEVLVCPSFKEGFGLPVLEALACGLPVVITRGGSLEEIAGEVGLYVDPRSPDEIAAAILAVLHGEPPVTKGKESLVRRAAHFRWKETAQKTLAVYNRVLEG